MCACVKPAANHSRSHARSPPPSVVVVVVDPCPRRLLVHLHHTVDLPDEPEARGKADGAGQQKEQEHHDRRVSEVKERGRSVLDRQLSGEVVETVDKQIHGREAGREERAPPPVVVLRAQMEVA